MRQPHFRQYGRISVQIRFKEFEMAFFSNLLTPSEDYNYKIIFLSYLVLSICCGLLFFGSKFWEDIKGFWIVVRCLSQMNNV